MEIPRVRWLRAEPTRFMLLWRVVRGDGRGKEFIERLRGRVGEQRVNAAVAVAVAATSGGTVSPCHP